MTLPAPLIQTEVDLTDFPFMPLDVRRLRDSDLASLESPEACWAAVLLWAASWHQVPAGSLPDDDRVLSQLAGFGRVVKEWMRIRDGALRSFVKCSDGRLYHPVVVEKAAEAWNGKLRLRWKRDCERIKKYHQRHKTDATYPLFEEWKTYRAETGVEQWPIVSSVSQGTLGDCPDGQRPAVPRDVGIMSPPCPPQNPVDSGQGTGDRGQGIGDKGQVLVNRLSEVDASRPPQKSNPLQPAAPAALKKKELTAEETAFQAVCRETWGRYSEAYALRYGTTPIRNAKINGQVRQFCQRVPTSEAPAIAGFFVRHNAAFYVSKGHAVGLLLADAEKLRTEWATNQTITATQAQQADKTQANGNAWGKVIAGIEERERNAAAIG